MCGIPSRVPPTVCCRVFLSPLLTLLLVECRCGGVRGATTCRSGPRLESATQFSIMVHHSHGAHSLPGAERCRSRLCHLSRSRQHRALNRSRLARETCTCNRAVSKSNLPSATFITANVASELGGEGPKEGIGPRCYPVGHVACKGRSIPFFGRITRIMRTSCRQNRQFGTPKK